MAGELEEGVGLAHLGMPKDIPNGVFLVVNELVP